MSSSSSLSAEQTFWLKRLDENSSEYIIGVDEVGYGALAGPVTVCAAVVRRGWSDPKVRDSKVVSPYNRQRLVEDVLVYPTVEFQAVVSENNASIDKNGLVFARDRAVAVAVTACVQRYPGAPVVMDGNQVPSGVPKTTICLIKADSLVPAVSAASIIAKVERDWYMTEMHKRYSRFGFDNNSGYGTLAHFQGLKDFGPCALHRMSIHSVRKHARPKLVG